MKGEIAVRDVVDQLYKSHAEAVRNFVLKRTKNTTQTDDIVSEVFLRCLSVLKRRGVDAIRKEYFRTYLIQIALNLIIDGSRRRGNWQTAPLDEVYEQADTAPLADEDIERIEMRYRVSRALRRLDSQKQKMLFLRYSDELTIPKISSAMGVKQGAVKVRLFRILQELRKQLK